MTFVRKTEAGRIFAEIRYELGYSQEYLAEIGDCSRSLIQKIESGDIVSEKTFVRLMDVMGVRDIDYDELYVNDTKERLALRQEIIIAITVGNLTVASKRLEAYKTLCENTRFDSRENRQFIMFFERLIFLMEDNGWELSQEEWLEMIRLTIPEYRFGEMIERASMTGTELMLFNIYALGLMWNGDYDMSRKLFGEMFSKVGNVKIKGLASARAKSAVSVNLAFCLLYMDETALAEELIKKAVKGFMINGGAFGWLQLLKALLMLYERSGSHMEYYMLLENLRSGYKYISGLYRMKRNFEEFLKERPGMIVL